MVSLTGHSLTSHRRASAASNRSSVDETRSNGEEDETTVVEPDQGNVLSHIISQLRPGADLSRVVLPTFILEPRSMLERITNFMAHPETLLPMPDIDDPVERFVSVVKFYLSGWHIKPPGVKKPLNPILGETFTCYWEFPDKTKGYYISEQTSHHPPKSSYFYMAPEHHIRIDGCLKPRSKFLGNSAASLMEGIAILRFTNRGKSPKGESYILTQPNMYARGILFGKMKYELGDHSYVRCPELGLTADIEFKTKGYFGGTYNAIGGVIKNEHTGEVLFELAGMWNGEMIIINKKTGKKEVLFDATKSRHTPPTARPLEEQEERESQKLWYKTAQAVKERNHEVATDEKTIIEDMQRDEAAKRVEEGVEWHPRLFRHVQGGPGGLDDGEEDLDWILNATIDGSTPEKQIEQILAVTPILKGQKSTEKNQIPPHHDNAESHEGVSKAPEQQQVSQPQAPRQQIPQQQTQQPQEQQPVVHQPIAQQSQAPQQYIQESVESHPTPPRQENLAVDSSQSTSTGRKSMTLSEFNSANGGGGGSESQPDIEQILRSTGIPQQGGALIDFHNDMKDSLPASSSGKLRRNDTDDSVDEFVDAEG